MLLKTKDIRQQNTKPCCDTRCWKRGRQVQNKIETHQVKNTQLNWIYKGGNMLKTKQATKSRIKIKIDNKKETPMAQN